MDYLDKLAAMLLERTLPHLNGDNQEFRIMLSRARADCQIRIWLKTRPWTRPPWQTGRRKSIQRMRDVCRWNDSLFWKKRTETLVVPQRKERRRRQKS